LKGSHEGDATAVSPPIAGTTLYALPVSNTANDTPDRRMPPWIFRAILMFWGSYAALTLGQSVIKSLKDLLIMLLISLFLSLAIEPAVNALERRGMKRGLATGLLLIGLTLLTVAFLAAIGALLAKQITSLAEKAPDYVTKLETWVNTSFRTKIDTQAVRNKITSTDGPLKNVAGSILGWSTSVLSAIFQLLGVALFTFYMVAEGPKMRRVVCSRLQPGVQERVLEAWEVAMDKTGGYIYSRATLGFFSAACHWVVMIILGVPYNLALAVWVGLISQFLPVIGTYLAGALPVIVALADHPSRAVWLLVFIVLYQQFENYVLLPRITARTMELHAAIAFGAAIAGGAVLGPVGAILALPLAASIQSFLTMYGRRHEIVDSHLTQTQAAPDPVRGRVTKLTKKPKPAE
jgi:predicted PurR-regulated permease PerM